MASWFWQNKGNPYDRVVIHKALSYQLTSLSSRKPIISPQPLAMSLQLYIISLSVALLIKMPSGRRAQTQCETAVCSPLIIILLAVISASERPQEEHKKIFWCVRCDGHDWNVPLYDTLEGHPAGELQCTMTKVRAACVFPLLVNLEDVVK